MPEQLLLCIRCGQEVQGNYCSNCGQPAELKRINGPYILREISQVLNFDKGILFTIKELLVRPGKNIQRFILEERYRLVKPVIFVIICSLIYTIFQQVFGFEDGYVNFSYDDWDELVIGKIFIWVSKNYGYANLIMAIFIAFWVKLFFRKYDYNYFEIVVMLCYVMGFTMLIYAVFGLVESLTGWAVLQIGANIGFLYIAWAIAQFFDKRKVGNYFKALFSYIFGMLTFVLLVTIIGIVLGYILN